MFDLPLARLIAPFDVCVAISSELRLISRLIETLLLIARTQVATHQHLIPLLVKPAGISIYSTGQTLAPIPIWPPNCFCRTISTPFSLPIASSFPFPFAFCSPSSSVLFLKPAKTRSTLKCNSPFPNPLDLRNILPLRPPYPHQCATNSPIRPTTPHCSLFYHL